MWIAWGKCWLCTVQNRQNLKGETRNKAKEGHRKFIFKKISKEER
jgi:hypothetical protein